MNVGKKRTAVIAAVAAAALVVVSPITALAASSETLDATGTTQANATVNTQRDGLLSDGAENIGVTDIDVQAKVSGGPEIVYSVTIKWGDMQFEYDYGSTWNPTTHSYNAGASGQAGGGWVATYVTGTNTGTPVNNGIIITNDSNFPVTADFAYDGTTGTTALNADTTVAGSVVGIFADANSAFTSAVLAAGKDGSFGAASLVPSTMTLEMDHSNVTAAGTFYYYKDAADGSNIGNKYFALSGTPDTSGPASFTNVGKITVTIQPATGVTKVTNS